MERGGGAFHWSGGMPGGGLLHLRKRVLQIVRPLDLGAWRDDGFSKGFLFPSRLLHDGAWGTALWLNCAGSAGPGQKAGLHGTRGVSALLKEKAVSERLGHTRRSTRLLGTCDGAPDQTCTSIAADLTFAGSVRFGVMRPRSGLLMWVIVRIPPIARVEDSQMWRGLAECRLVADLMPFTGWLRAAIFHDDFYAYQRKRSRIGGLTGACARWRCGRR